MHGDDRPKFVGVFQGGTGHYGPACPTPSGIEISSRYQGTPTWAVDERGMIYHLCRDFKREGAPLVWVQMHAGVVRDVNEET